MDSSAKKRKAEENGTTADVPNGSTLSPEDARKIIEPFTQDQLLDILQKAAVRHADVLESIRSIADRDPAQRKLFIRGLGWDTTTENLRSLFSTYGDLEEAVVILDKVSGKSKGYGFITFKHIDGALLALKEPSKKIDGRMTVTQLASSGTSGPTANPPPTDASLRKIYVGNVPYDMPPDRLLVHFSSYGEIEEGPLGFDKVTGKSRGFALFVYKGAEAARASLVDPIKTIDGHQMVCKLAIEGKRGKPGGAVGGTGGAQGQALGGSDVVGADGTGMLPPVSVPGSLSSQYGGSGPLSAYAGLGGYPGGHQTSSLGGHHSLNSPLQTSVGGSGIPSVGSQVPSSLSVGSGGYGSSLGASYGGSQYGGSGTGGYTGLTGSSSLYRIPPTSGGIPSAAYAESVTGHYSLSSSVYAGSQHQQSGASSVPKPLPSSGMYQSMPPYY